MSHKPKPSRSGSSASPAGRDVAARARELIDEQERQLHELCGQLRAFAVVNRLRVPDAGWPKDAVLEALDLLDAWADWYVPTAARSASEDTPNATNTETDDA
jgi:hypothetical protein